MSRGANVQSFLLSDVSSSSVWRSSMLVWSYSVATFLAESFIDLCFTIAFYSSFSPQAVLDPSA